MKKNSIIMVVLLMCFSFKSYAGNITFADANVKAICVNHWDTNGDGELSEAEAAVVTTLDYMFRSESDITSFNELQYFTSLTSIESDEFSYCYGLISITIPNSVTSIGDYAFMGCSGLTSVTVERIKPLPITFYTFFGANRQNATLFVPNGSKEAYMTADGWRGFMEIVEIGPVSPAITFTDANVKSLCVRNWDTNGDGELSEAEAANVTTLGEVFRSISDITSFDELQYFTGLTSIGNDTFSGCSGLTSVTIPNSVTSIGYWAFALCTGLTSVTIPNSVTSIEEDAFYGCSGLTEIIVENGNNKYDSRDNCNAIIETASNTLIIGCMNTVIPNSVTSIGDYAFSDCSSLASVTIPNSVTSIGRYAFRRCSSLASVTIPNSVTSIENGAFEGCI